MPFCLERGVPELFGMALHIKVLRTRPRVYLSEYNLADIRGRIETTHLEEWSQLVVWSRGIARTPAEYRLRDERLGERARRLAFMHAVRPEERLVEMALEMVPALVKLTGRLPASPTGIDALAQLYDSFHAELSEALAAEIAQSLARGADDIFSVRIKGRSVLSEARSQAVAPLLAAGLSLYVEHRGAALTASRRIIGQAVHASRDLLGTLQYFLETDGGFPLGWAEGLTHLGQVPKLAMLAESGLDQAWPRDVPWLARYAEFLENGMEDALEDGAESDTEDEPAPAPRTRRTGPFWPGGAETGTKRAELWRILAMIASESGTPAALRLLGRIRLPGHQDERILYERRPLPSSPKGGDVPAAKGRTRLYRRAGLVLFRGAGHEKGDASTRFEAVVRCPVALVAGGGRLGVGSFSISCGTELLSGTARAPNGLLVGKGGSKGGEGRSAPKRDAAEDSSRDAPFPRTRHEIGETGFHTATIIAFESDIGATVEGGHGLLDWLRVDLTPAHRAYVESAVRTFVMMRALPGGRGAAFVVADDVRLCEEGGEAASVVSFAAKPEVDGNLLTAKVGNVRLRDFVLEPEQAGISLEALDKSTDPPTWRALVSAGEAAPKERLVCQVFVADSLDPDGPAQGADRPKGRAVPGRDPLCVRLPSEGALAIDVAGRVLVLGGGDAARIECVTAGEVDGVAAVGMKASARARLEVAGEEPVRAATSGAGSVYFNCRVPAGTGFVLTAEGEADEGGENG